MYTCMYTYVYTISNVYTNVQEHGTELEVKAKGRYRQEGKTYILQVHPYIYTYKYICINVYMNIYIYIYVCVCTTLCVSTSGQDHVLRAHFLICMYIQIAQCAYTFVAKCTNTLHLCIHFHMNAFMYVCIHTCDMGMYVRVDLHLFWRSYLSFCFMYEYTHAVYLSMPG